MTRPIQCFPHSDLLDCSKKDNNKTLDYILRYKWINKKKRFEQGQRSKRVKILGAHLQDAKKRLFPRRGIEPRAAVINSLKDSDVSHYTIVDHMHNVSTIPLQLFFYMYNLPSPVSHTPCPGRSSSARKACVRDRRGTTGTKKGPVHLLSITLPAITLFHRSESASRSTVTADEHDVHN